MATPDTNPSQEPVTPRRGRRRDPDLENRILLATADLLVEQGYRQLRIEDIAGRAGVGLGALYRRWPSKRDIVIAALANAVPDQGLPSTNDARADVLAGWRAVLQGAVGSSGRLLAEIAAESNTDAVLADAVRHAVLERPRAENRRRLARVLGDVCDLGVRADIGPAYILFSVLFLRHEPDPDELDRLLELVVAPATKAQLPGQS